MRQLTSGSGPAMRLGWFLLQQHRGMPTPAGPTCWQESFCSQAAAKELQGREHWKGASRALGVLHISCRAGRPSQGCAGKLRSGNGWCFQLTQSGEQTL